MNLFCFVYGKKTLGISRNSQLYIINIIKYSIYYRLSIYLKNKVYLKKLSKSK